MITWEKKPIEIMKHQTLPPINHWHPFPWVFCEHVDIPKCRRFPHSSWQILNFNRPPSYNSLIWEFWMPLQYFHYHWHVLWLFNMKQTKYTVQPQNIRRNITATLKDSPFNWQIVNHCSSAQQIGSQKYPVDLVPTFLKGRDTESALVRKMGCGSFVCARYRSARLT